MPILYYHNVVDEPVDGFDFCRLPAAEFARQARYLADHFRPLSLPAFMAELGAEGPDPRALVMTFDDAYQGVFEHAFPVLEALGIPATVFIVTDTLRRGGETLLHHDEIEVALRITQCESLRFELAEGGESLPLTTFDERLEALRQVKRKLKILPEAERARWHRRILARLQTPPPACRAAARGMSKLRFMTRSQLRTLRDSGWTLGSHTRSHRTVSRLEEEDLRREIHGSLADLERELGLAEIPFAYPYGLPEHIGTRAPRMVAEAGYTCALTATAPAEESWDLFQLPRMDFETLRQRSGGR